MNNPTIPRTLVGTVVILIGLAALLGGFELIDFSHLFMTYWPTLVVAGGLLILLTNPREQYTWALLFIAVGLLWQMRTIEVIDFNVWAIFWPLLLIAIGWSVVSNRTFGTTQRSGSSENNTSAILGAVESKIESKDFKEAHTTVILGGSTINLRNAKIKKEATIEIFTLMGGVEIKIPEDWSVKSSVLPILGGFSDSTTPTESKSAPVLNIVGTTVLGGVDIKR